MVRSIFLLFGVAAYLIFFTTFLYMVGFVADLAWLPRTIDRPDSALSLGATLLLDGALIALFGVQHSVMARQGFKAAWTRIVPAPIERSTYVIFASLALILMFALWAPLPGVLWDVTGTAFAPLVWLVFASGWAIVLLSTLLISHFELFGLKQVWHALREAPAVTPTLRQPFFYRFVRHPLYTGFFIAFWVTPRMTQGHLLFASGMSLYMLIAIEFEERDLLRIFGGEYEDYRSRVGKLAPRFGRSR